MGSLARELVEDTDAIVARWLEAWRRSPHPHVELSEAALKDNLPLQLRLIGEQLEDLGAAERTAEMWKVTDRLDPELRVSQEVAIEEVVHEYRLVVHVVRDWIEERRIDVPFDEYSYFYAAIFELTAESVRRFTRHQAERQREERARYLAGVMHQLRTPLAALVMASALLQRGPRERNKTLALLERNIGRIRAMVESVLRLERYAPSETPVKPEELRASELVDEIVADYAAEAERKELEVEARIDPSLRVTVDRTLFTDALGNLVQNAVKFTTAGHVEIVAQARGDEVRFEVRDTGPGIAPEQQGTLFREVQPGAAGGTGLGLRIAHHAATAHGGRIELESEPGVGSVFTLCLPRVVAARDGA